MPRASSRRAENNLSVSAGSRKTRPNSAPVPKKGSLVLLFAIVPLAIVAVIFSQTALEMDRNRYAVWLISWGIATFVTYGLDKALAKLGWWRVPGILLHVLALIGGFAGGWLGMFIWRHKTTKARFWAVLFASTLLHGGAVYWFYVAKGTLPKIL